MSISGKTIGRELAKAFLAVWSFFFVGGIFLHMWAPDLRALEGFTAALLVLFLLWLGSLILTAALSFPQWSNPFAKFTRALLCGHCLVGVIAGFIWASVLGSETFKYARVNSIQRIQAQLQHLNGSPVSVTERQ